MSLLVFLLKEKDTERDGERQTVREISHLLIHSQVPTMAGTGLGHSWEPEIQSRSPMWVEETQLLEPSPAVSQGRL